jgi:quercetin dioxygenase-like cupin family protein
MKTNRTRMVAVAGLVFGIGAALAAQAPAITRTQLNKMDMTWMNHEALTARADIPMGGGTGKHTHAGDEVTYVAEGMVTLEIEGMPSRTVKTGEAYFVPAGKIHNVSAAGGKAVAIANYLVEKGKPLTTPVQ